MENAGAASARVVERELREIDARLAEWTELTVRVDAPADLRYSWFSVEAVLGGDGFPDTRAGVGMFGWSGATGANPGSDPVESDGTRTFRLRLGPGSYRLESRGAFLTFESVAFEIGHLGVPRQLDLVARVQ